MTVHPVQGPHGLFRSHPSTKHGARLFVRNCVASGISFTFDLGLLWCFKEFGQMADLVAVAVAFLLAMTLHYVLARVWVFRGTERGVATGYIYFLVNAAAGLTITLSLFALLSRLPGFHYLASRALASVVAGIVVFFLNAVFNFRQLGAGRTSPLPNRSMS